MTEKRMRDIVLYCVSMDEIQLSAGEGWKTVVFIPAEGQKTLDVKIGNCKIIQKFTREFGPLEKKSSEPDGRF